MIFVWLDWHIASLKRSNVAGHTNEKGRRIRLTPLKGGKLRWLTNKVWDVPFGIWVTTHSFEVISSMKWEKAYKLCTQITGKIIDDSVKNCCIFVYLDEANYDYKGGKFVEVTWDELMKECTPVEVIVYE